jgi:hypothetical protein
MAKCPFCVVSRRSLVRGVVGSALALAAGTGSILVEKALA